MIRDLSRFTDFLVREKITANQFYFLYANYLDKLEDGGKRNYIKRSGDKRHPIANVYKYVHAKLGWSEEEIEDLVARGFLRKQMEKMGYDLDNLVITTEFKMKLFAGMANFDEFWDEYPPFLTIDGKMIPIRSEKDTARKLYYERVPTVYEHEKLMRALRWAKERGDMLNMNINKFLDGDIWQGIADQMMGNEETPLSEKGVSRLGNVNEEIDFDA